MTRARPADYAGAIGRASPRDVVRFGGRWVLQPKLDGCYCHVHLDGAGRIASVRARGVAEFGRKVLEGLLGAFVGWPDSVLVGELEAHTEWSTRTATEQGYRRVHLFDVVRAGRVYMGHQPYHVRRAELWRMQSEVVNLAPTVPWTRDDQGFAHDRLTGQFTHGRPTDFRLTPIVPQLAAAKFNDAWSTWGPDAGGEGLVAVNLDAPLGHRRSKLKIKRQETIDCRVISVGARALQVAYGNVVFALSASSAQRVAVGDVVEVMHEGWYEKRAMPRFARLVRTRPDKEGMRC